MSQYVTSPFKQSPALLVAGRPSYVFGSWNDKTGPTIGQLLSDAGVTTVGTAVFQIQSGNIPIVGSSITIVGASNSPNFNVTNATVLTVVANADTGVVTVTFAISSTNQATLADSGIVQIPQPEIGEAIVNATASVPVALSFSTANPDEARGITVVVSFPSLPTAAGVSLQQAVQDIDSEYKNVATVATVSGGVITAGPQITVDPVLGRFLRLYIEASGGTLPTIVGKILG